MHFKNIKYEFINVYKIQKMIFTISKINIFGDMNEKHFLSNFFRK